MIVIYGTRFYGQVDSHGGQHHLTRFFHIYYVPLVPVQALWVTQEVDGRYHGHDVKMSGRSVLAGYARIWGPLAAVIAVATGGVGGVVAAAAALGATAMTWTWRSRRSAREQRRSDFHLLAFGTRCDPLDMEQPLASTLQHNIAQRWAEVSGGNTPEDVARRGEPGAGRARVCVAPAGRAARAGHARARGARRFGPRDRRDQG
ncbi:MAG: hypothetical protein ABIY55_11715 [Kofleriaceae bacterium]